ncbi:receptor like protein 50 [Artemisia annua]|uniref:Receptor like protein 50 n=1 Tax=Artemisia annua TaxID=35608 RepID=A0A2U1KFB0_ARTAN|nr:receptor like protein 50 [Artemisia annua]
MKSEFQFSYISSFYYRLILLALFHSWLSNTNTNAMLCRDDERQALLQFKHGLIDEANRLASWVGKESDCCRWAGIGCDNSTGHVHRIHLPGSSYFYANSVKEYKEALKKQLRGDLSPSILNLLQLRHLDLSCNDFGGIQVPSFMGSFQNLRYLNLSQSGFGGTIPPQLGNLTELRILCLGSFYTDTDEPESTSVMNLQWLSRLHMLHHLDMSSVDLSKAIDWFQVINSLPSLVELHLSNSQLQHIHPHVASLNLTSLSLLDLSRNNFSNSFVPPWIFSQTGLVSLDLTFCGFPGPVSTSYNSFHNLTSLKFLHVSGNAFMSSSLVLEVLSRVAKRPTTSRNQSIRIKQPIDPEDRPSLKPSAWKMIGDVKYSVSFWVTSFVNDEECFNVSKMIHLT